MAAVSASTGTKVGSNELFMKPSTRLRKLISQEGVCIQAPGVYDGICARVAIEQGFQVMVQFVPEVYNHCTVLTPSTVPIRVNDYRFSSWSS